MTTVTDVILVDIMQAIVALMKVQVPLAATGTFYTINYEPGRNEQILHSISEIDNSTSMKGLKYPLFAMLMPIKESRGNSGGFYGTVIIPRIVFATLCKKADGVEPVLDKYSSTGNFKSVLYPMYNEFLKRLGTSGYFIGSSDVNMIPHTKMDNPGQQPVGENMDDFIDSIEILNLELTLNQFKTC